MNKFENVDIFASLDAIMRQNTGFFQSDAAIFIFRSGTP